MLSNSKILETAATFGLPVGGSVMGLALTFDHTVGVQLVASIIGALCGVLSVGLRGWFRLQERKHDAKVKLLEARAARHRRRLIAAGLDPDTEEQDETV